jgi:hypothetical protein
MEQVKQSSNRKDYIQQAVILWPSGIRNEPVIYPLGATDEETEAIRRLLKRMLKLGQKS